MKQYDSYKESGISWIGKIPTHWEQCRLKSYNSLKGRIGWKGLRSDEFLTEGYAYLVTGQDFSGRDIQWEKCYQIEKTRYDEDPFIQLENGNLLITKDGTIGKIATVNNLDKPACLNSGIFVMKQKKAKFDQGYLFWLLSSDLLKEFNNYTSSGTTILHLYQNVFENMPMIVPPMGEQIKIAAFLDDYCKKIDKAIETQENKSKLLNELRQTIITKAVTSKQINFQNPCDKNYISTQGWVECQLKNAIIGMQDGTHGTFTRVPEGRMLLSAKNVFEDGIRIGKNESYISEQDYESIVANGYPTKGDIAICCVGTIGRCCLYKEDEVHAFQRSVTFLRPRKTVNPEFLLYALRSRDAVVQFDQLAKTSAQSGIYMGALAQVRITLPPKEEQNQIVNYLKEKLGPIKKEIDNSVQQIEKLKEYKQSLITEVVTGKRKIY